MLTYIILIIDCFTRFVELYAALENYFRTFYTLDSTFLTHSTAQFLDGIFQFFFFLGRKSAIFGSKKSIFLDQKRAIKYNDFGSKQSEKVRNFRIKKSEKVRKRAFRKIKANFFQQQLVVYIRCSNNRMHFIIKYLYIYIYYQYLRIVVQNSKIILCCLFNLNIKLQ